MISKTTTTNPAPLPGEKKQNKTTQQTTKPNQNKTLETQLGSYLLSINGLLLFPGICLSLVTMGYNENMKFGFFSCMLFVT